MLWMMAGKRFLAFDQSSARLPSDSFIAIMKKWRSTRRRHDC
jgi:hypothetical protein